MDEPHDVSQTHKRYRVFASNGISVKAVLSKNLASKNMNFTQSQTENAIFILANFGHFFEKCPRGGQDEAFLGPTRFLSLLFDLYS
jgi:hypothetical protein